jgi:hypothetical protein
MTQDKPLTEQDIIKVSTDNDETFKIGYLREKVLSAKRLLKQRMKEEADKHLCFESYEEAKDATYKIIDECFQINDKESKGDD